MVISTKQELTIIRDDQTYQASLNCLDKIYHPTTKEQEDESDLLAMLIAKYEAEHFEIKEADPIQKSKL